jgi:hypothetical protein
LNVIGNGFADTFTLFAAFAILFTSPKE